MRAIAQRSVLRSVHYVHIILSEGLLGDPKQAFAQYYGMIDGGGTGRWLACRASNRPCSFVPSGGQMVWTSGDVHNRDLTLHCIACGDLVSACVIAGLGVVVTLLAQSWVPYHFWHGCECTCRCGLGTE